MKLVIFLLLVTSVAATIDWDTIVPEEGDPHISSLPEEPKEEPKEEGRIANGKIAFTKQFPYQVGLLVHLQKGSAWCGGTLISDQWILTAAHCTDSIVSADVYLGTFDRTDKYERGQRILKVARKNIIIHERWNPSLVQNDIALIKLPYPVAFNEYIQPAKLPKFVGTYSSYSATQAIASGWGRTGDAATSSTDKLRWILVPIMGNSECVNYFGASVRDTNICIDTKGYKSTCNGDSGGPLVLADDSNTVIGITSFGIKLGCEKGWPGVFTRVTSYLDWIADNSGVVSL